MTQIRELFGKEWWRYCTSGLNPADIASRGAKCSELKLNKLWWNGPPFLQEERSQWPTNITAISSDISELEEVKCEERFIKSCKNPTKREVG